MMASYLLAQAAVPFTLDRLGMLLGVAGSAAALVVGVYRLGVNTTETRHVKEDVGNRMAQLARVVDDGFRALSARFDAVESFTRDTIERRGELQSWRLHKDQESAQNADAFRQVRERTHDLAGELQELHTQHAVLEQRLEQLVQGRKIA